MIIPHHMLSPEALHSVIEAFVTREGTDYGAHAGSRSARARGDAGQAPSETLGIFPFHRI